MNYQVDEKLHLQLGAGILPFTFVNSNQPLLLFQKLSKGRKKGLLVDFGGKLEEEEILKAYCSQTEEKNKNKKDFISSENKDRNLETDKDCSLENLIGQENKIKLGVKTQIDHYLKAAIREFNEETGGFLEFEGHFDKREKSKKEEESECKSNFILKNLEKNWGIQFHEDKCKKEKLILEKKVLTSKELLKKAENDYQLFEESQENNKLYQTFQTITNGIYFMYLLPIRYFDTKILNEIYEIFFEKRREFEWIELEVVLNKKNIIPLHPRIDNAENFYKVLSRIQDSKII